MTTRLRGRQEQGRQERGRQERGQQEQGQQDRGRQDRGRQESVEEAADRRWTDLVQEVRIAQTGAQIMFGFLLSVAFTDRFARLHGFDRSLYDTVVVLGAVAIGTLIAPVTYHRILAGHHVKPLMVNAVSRLVGLGVTLLALAIGCALLLLMRVAGLGWGAWLIAGLALAWFGMCWVALPTIVRHRGQDVRRSRQTQGDPQTQEDQQTQGGQESQESPGGLETQGRGPQRQARQGTTAEGPRGDVGRHRRHVAWRDLRVALCGQTLPSEVEALSLAELDGARAEQVVPEEVCPACWARYRSTP